MAKKPEKNKPYEPPFLPKLAHADIELMLMAMLRSRKVRTEALRFLKYEYFEPNRLVNYKANFSELGLTTLFEVILKLAPAYEDKTDIPCCDITAAVDETFQSRPGTSEARDEILAEDGPLERAYSAMKRTDFSAKKMLDLVRRFCIERATNRHREQITQMEGTLPVDLPTLVAAYDRELERIGTIGQGGGETLLAQFDALNQKLDAGLGRKFHGFKTGFVPIDKMGGRGLSNVTLLGAYTGVGKTALCLQLVLGMLQQPENGNASILYISLEMPRATLFARAISHLGEISEQIVSVGSDGLVGASHGPYRTETDQEQVDAGMERLRAIAGRLIILDPSTIDAHIDTLHLRRLIADAKQQNKTSRCFVVIDHLGLIDAPPEILGSGELAADKFRVALAKSAIVAPAGMPIYEQDALLAILEVRKPAADGARQGDLTIHDLLGSVRLGHQAQNVLMLEPMRNKELLERYGARYPGKKGASAADAAKVRALLGTTGIAPTTISMPKGRDGSYRGRAQTEFHFRKSTFVACEDLVDEDIHVTAPAPVGPPEPTVLEKHQAVIEAAFTALDPAALAKGLSLNGVAELLGGYKPTATKVLEALIADGKIAAWKPPGKKFPRYRPVGPDTTQIVLDDEEE
jgi:DnaB-like helicase C terminal domain